MHKENDRFLVQKLKEKNKYAFEELFLKYHIPLVNYCLSLCKNRILAQEAVQNLFIYLWSKPQQIDHEENIANYLFKGTRNQLIDCIRKEKIRQQHENSSNIELPDNNDAVENNQIVKAIIESAIQQLPPKSKEVFRLCKKEGLTYDEVADYLKISKKTVENQMSIAFKKMKSYLERYKNLISF